VRHDLSLRLDCVDNSLMDPLPEALQHYHRDDAGGVAGTRRSSGWQRWKSPAWTTLRRSAGCASTGRPDYPSRALGPRHAFEPDWEAHREGTRHGRGERATGPLQPRGSGCRPIV